jgi:hypothetical protein
MNKRNTAMRQLKKSRYMAEIFRVKINTDY